MNAQITILQASRWLAVTNLGGPFTSRNTKPKSGEDIDRIWNSDRQASDSDEMFEGFEAERKDFEKQIRSRKHGKYWRQTLAKEGLEIVE